MKTMKRILQEASQLTEEQRLTLVHQLMLLGEPERTDDINSAWDSEIRDRIMRYDCGETLSRPAEEVFSDIDRCLKDHDRRTA